ncbi:50S ribosomal protein L15 [Maritalea sp.]|uniref:50S ribosomal protein L15 n=1 Tax=Maritalea sp. TaxID=2003361 RepID=UPI003EF1679D
MRLNELADNEGSSKDRTRIGRGIGSGKGKTGGRGVKGQKSRSGVSVNGFRGEQTNLIQQMPKRGFNNPFAKKFNAVRLDRIQTAIDAGRLDAKGVIDVTALVGAGVIRRAKDGLRLIAGNNEFTSKKVTFKADHASKGALAAVEAAGGKIDLPAAAPAEAE